MSQGQTVVNTADLTVARDNLGRVYIPATALKGSAKSHITLTKENGEIIAKILFGSADEETKEIKLKKHIGLIGFQDAYLVFVPVPSTLGTLYITSPLLLQKLFEALELDELPLIDIQENKLSCDTILIRTEEKYVDLVGGLTLKAKQEKFVGILEDLISKILDDVKLYNVLSPRVGIVDDAIIDIILNKALIIRPGIKIEGFSGNDLVYNKVVSEEGPRFEEEIPLGSIFTTKIILTRTQVELKKFIEGDKKQEDMISEILNANLSGLSIILEKNSSRINLNESVLYNLIKTYLHTLFIGARETLSKGIIRMLPAEYGLTIKYKPVSTSQQRKDKISLAKKEVSIQEIKNIIKIVKTKDTEDIESIAERLKGKVSSLPERLRTMDLLTILYFYLKIKEEAKGEGYEEIREIAKHLIANEELDNIEIKNGLIISNIDKYLTTIDKIIRLFTLLKYIIRSYGG